MIRYFSILRIDIRKHPNRYIKQCIQNEKPEFFLVVTCFFDQMDLNMDVAFYHPTESERKIMKELHKCPQQESRFKRVNED